jgi:hypothetical protein
VLRVTTYFSPESLGIHQQRIPTNRGNAYMLPHAIGNPRSLRHGEIQPSWDCKNTGAPGNGEVDATPDNAACTIQPDFPPIFGGKAFPQLYADP